MRRTKRRLSRCVGQLVTTPASQRALWQAPAAVGLQLVAVGALMIARPYGSSRPFFLPGRISRSDKFEPGPVGSNPPEMTSGEQQSSATVMSSFSAQNLLMPALSEDPLVSTKR
jgi:hypothetical protein